MNQRFTAHDVRKLRICAICDGLGHLDRMLSLPGFPGLYHGECSVRMLSRAEVLALPENELRKLTLADTGMDLMREMVDRSKPANVGVEPETPALQEHADGRTRHAGGSRLERRVRRGG